MVVPDGHDQDHAVGEGITHLGQAALGGERVGVAESGLLGSAPSVGDRVSVSEAGDVGLGVLVDDTVLDVDAADLREFASGGTVVGDESEGVNEL